MAEETPKTTRKFLWVRSPHFETRRFDSVLVEDTDRGGVFMKFFVGRPEVEAMHEFEVLENGDLGEIVSEKFDAATVFEVQQGIILDRDEALSLRDKLNELLEEEPS